MVFITMKMIKYLKKATKSYGYANAPKDVQTGDTGKFSIAFGGDINDGKGHVTAFFEHTDTKPMLQGEFDISACALSGGTWKMWWFINYSSRKMG